LEGSVSLKITGGEQRVVVAGDTVFFPAGASAEWTVDNYIRKLAFCRTPLPGWYCAVRSMGRRIKRVLKGNPSNQDSGFL
jgi:hypothetical protein